MGLDSFKEDIKKEADAGNSDAMNLLGVIARNENEMEKAKSGDVDALYFVVGCYLVGRYVKKQDENKAMQILIDIKHISKKDAKMVISELLK